MSTRAVVALGVGQLVNWGVLYYAFAVLLVPVERDLGVQRWVVAGAFSLALLMSAALAPVVGAWSDRGHAALVMRTGGFAAAALLALWALVPGVAVLYLTWAGLGLCMAATLYEPAFSIVARAARHPPERLRALAAVTVFGGLASTVFLPATAILLGASGWRGTVAVLACVLAASTAATWWFALRHLPPLRPGTSASPPSPSPAADDRIPNFWPVLAVFSLTSLASAALFSNLIPALGDRGIAPTTAAMVGGLLGLLQLPGRALLMSGAAAASPSRLLLISLVFQGAGLAALAASSSIGVAVGGAMVFAAGGGLTTVVRPHFVQTMFGSSNAGSLNGQIARWQQLARAAGPVMAAWLAAAGGYGALFAVMAIVFAILALTCVTALDSGVPYLPFREESS